MRNLFFGLLLLISAGAVAQQKFNNEWIDYAKTYYKFKVGSNGVYRIPAAALNTAGLGSVAAENFQLWRNGEQVPLFASKASGTFGASDYIEFWGQMNDGKPDRDLYRNPSFQLNDKWSLLTDSASYFLTVNITGNNLRLQPAANNISGNTLPAEPYFMHVAGKYYRDRLNAGLYNVVVTDNLFSSSYDKGEGFTSTEVQRNATLTENFTNLFAASTGPAPNVRVAVTGNSWNNRRYTLHLNGDSILGDLLPYMNESVKAGSFNASLISGNSVSVAVKNLTDPCTTSNCPVDRIVVHKIEITYARQFNFGGAQNFEFSLPASNTGNYLDIAGFNHGGTPPVLYDLTNGKRYEAQISGTQVRVVLEASATERKLVLVSLVAANVSAIDALETRNFVNYNTAATQGDYLIISNPLLFDGAGGTNPVEEYRTYRASATGGLYNAKIYLEDQLIDQFGFGIKKNPAGIRNFIMYARRNFPVMPRQVFLIGRGVHYRDQRNNESSASATRKANLEKLNLVPTFGHPASDMLLVSDLSTSTPLMPIGRLTAITPAEVSTYLKKVKEYEQAQQTLSPFVQDKRWMKNVAHIIGAGEGILDDILFQYMEGYRLKVQDSLFGGKVSTFRKRSANAVEQLNDADLTRLINNGVSLLTYYGHSSPTTLEFNLDDPGNYNNQGKYPMFLALGCNAGNTFDYNEGRFSARSYLSDKYVLAPDRGSINFVASSHFGIVHYLDIWNTRAYANFSGPLYGRSIGEIIRKTVADMFSLNADDFFARCNAEETILNGDPAVTLNQQAKPDYVINADMVSVTPNFVSVADQTFRVKVNLLNLGKVTNKRIVVETKRQFPNQQTEVIRRDTIRGVRYSDSLIFSVPIDPLRDKGANRIMVTVDTDNAVEEIFETNNSASRDFAIFEEEARPVYPQPFAIVNQAGVSLKVSTANPFGDLKQYRMEIDTTETFNSSFKSSTTISSRGGLLEFTPGITYTAGTVYYWRVGPVAQGGNVVNWNMSSFVYLPGHEIGFNQSHVNQHTKSEFYNIKIDSAAGGFSFKEAQHEIFIRNGVYPATSNQNGFYYVYINGNPVLGPGCNYDELIFNVLDAKTLKPVANQYANGSGQYNSNPSCAADRKYNFMFTITQATGRKNAMDFLAQVPSGSYVIVRNNANSATNTYPNVWMSDTALYGSGNSLYHRLVSQGFANLDSFDRPRAWAFIFKKDDQSAFTPSSVFSQDIYDGLTLKVNGTGLDSSGHVVSPVFGPAKQWKSIFWSGASEESPSTDYAVIGLLGIRKNGTVDTLFKNIDVLTRELVDVSSIDASVHPHVQLLFESKDGTNYTPYQLRNWRISYLPVPEGALAPNVHLSVKDTVDVGEPLNFSIAFKNISEAAFDSLKVNMVVTDRNNMQHNLPVSKFKPLAINDTVHVRYNIDTRNLVGSNTLFLNVNPDGDQPEHFLFNNFGYRNFYVRGDTLNPLMDVTFDNVHILNNDIVSSRPDILIKLKDEAKWMTLMDTSIASVQVRFPSGQLRTYHFNSDTLTFTAATGAPNADNTASIRLKPNFQKDGNYELIVSGKDMSNNAAGALSYRVGFQVINKPMISNMLNYPNPFTTSTAFVFTLTGSEVPQNLRIQVLTVTGKIVREITKQELGPLRIGRNITDFKWDGTDQYGQKLANGVYLYRVITNQHGKSLDKFKPSGDETDKYFNNGYGKMYLMR